MDPKKMRDQFISETQSVEDYVDYITTGKQIQVPVIPFRTLESFPIEQRVAMDKLKVYSPYNTYLEIITPSISQITTKLMFIKDNLSYLDNDEIGEYNKAKGIYRNTFGLCGIGIAMGFAGTFLYQLITKTATRPALKPALKGGLIATLISIGVVRYQKYKHD